MKETIMMDRNESTKKSFAELWMDGFRQVAEDQAKAAEYGVRF